MKAKEIPSICSVTDADYDLTLRQDIANIEKLIQPSDSWSEQTITELLNQDINDCWAVIHSKVINSEVSNQKLIGNDDKGSEDIEVVAYCIFSKVFEVAEILKIGTLPNFQRRGYAESLLNMIIKQLSNKGLAKILLEVRADNIGAIKLYQKMGFETIHTRKGYYSFVDKDGINQRFDALIMEYIL